MDPEMPSGSRKERVRSSPKDRESNFDRETAHTDASVWLYSLLAKAVSFAKISWNWVVSFKRSRRVTTLQPLSRRKLPICLMARGRPPSCIISDVMASFSLRSATAWEGSWVIRKSFPSRESKHSTLQPWHARMYSDSGSRVVIRTPPLPPVGKYLLNTPPRLVFSTLSKTRNQSSSTVIVSRFPP